MTPRRRRMCGGGVEEEEEEEWRRRTGESDGSDGRHFVDVIYGSERGSEDAMFLCPVQPTHRVSPATVCDISGNVFSLITPRWMASLSPP